MKKSIDILISSKDNITLNEAAILGAKIEASLPKNIKVDWWGWKAN